MAQTASTILGTGAYLPDRVLHSTELGERLGVDPQWILDKTGIAERRVAAEDEATSDLATHAARRALVAAGVEASSVDLLILATTNPDQPLPSTACFVQHNLGASNAVAFDLAAACTGFIYALAIAHSMLTADPRRQCALVIGADIHSRSLDYTDGGTCVLFGDGAGAVVLAKTGDSRGIITTNIGTDGSGTGIVQIPAGGSRLPASADTVANGLHYARMRGQDARRTAVDVLPALMDDLARDSGIELSEADLIIPHQANGVMIEEWAKLFGAPPDHLHRTISWSGNTGAASVPIALDDAFHKGRLSEGDLVLLVALGAGVTWGAASLRWAVPSPAALG
ncbi:3-oxoacyl-ACP synthase III family protein [Amycolatopsis nigrescens]|uniref:3-oxoacyl-ACP synthase III family protein n=1 Tax=Amycolatopsis nigrescens TaxID=381445 RepID=UPI0003814CF6|nr:beta-ketoacyl-ACP synthase 3 [Amycolatopsis nigrescens]